MHIISSLKNKHIGVWGYGLFGKSMLRYLIDNNIKVTVMDKGMRPAELGDKNIHYITQEQMVSFFNSIDYVIPSQGISLTEHYQTYADKFIMELDIFHSINTATTKMFTIAITGTAGKTTVTTVLSELLASYGKKTVTGGNIGIPTIDLFSSAISTNAQIAVLETSSFQLAYTKQFAPDLAIITNISENHLDWHGSMDAYRYAKWHITDFQSSEQQCILPDTIAHHMAQEKRLPKSKIYVYTVIPQQHHPAVPDYSYGIFYVYDGKIWQKLSGQPPKELISLNALPDITFTQNWIIVISSLILLNIPIIEIILHTKTIKIPAHRLEKIGTYNGCTIYNDSKATTIEATQCALNKLSDNPILLILGGHGKGVNRLPLIASLPSKVKKIYCFGAEADAISNACKQYSIPVSQYADLKDLITECINDAIANDQILFSPAGSSWDLFTDYQERGNLFKKIVLEHITNR